MLQPGRSYSAASGYRYGFNGKELDNDISGQGNQYDYGFRIYNPRIGKFLSVDPLQADYPELSTFQFASNSPIQAIDLDGREIYHYLFYYNNKKEPVLEYVGKQTRESAIWEIFDYPSDNWEDFNGSKIDGKRIYVHQAARKGAIKSDAPDLVFNWHKELFDWQASGYKSGGTVPDNTAANMQRDATINGMQQVVSDKMAEYSTSPDPTVTPIQKQKTSATSKTNSQATAANGGNPEAAKSNAATSVQKVNGRNPINYRYANSTYTFAPGSIFAKKYPSGVRFTEKGFPDFSPYSRKTVDIKKLNKNPSTDFNQANKLSGFKETPEGFTWHHVENSTKLQLIPTDLHGEVKHTGGRATNCSN